MNDDEIKINLDDDWFKKILANTNGTTQYDLFTDDDKTINLGAIGSANNSPWTFNNTGGYSISTSGGTGATVNWPSTNGSFLGGYTNNQNLVWNETLSPKGLVVKGDSEFDGDVKIKGVSISETLEKIENRLAILHPNEELEAKWERLRELRRQYIELEKDILEKEKIWNILKK
jgi:hypothetical protein